MKQEELAKYSEEMKSKSLDELQKIEQELIKEGEQADKTLSEYKFDMPKENYEEAAHAVKYFLNSQSIQWGYVFGMIELYEFFEGKMKEKLPFAILHTLLSTLGNMSFKGYDEWKYVATINSYFEPLKPKYVELANKAYDIADKHNAVMQAIQLNSPIKEDQSK